MRTPGSPGTDGKAQWDFRNGSSSEAGSARAPSPSAVVEAPSPGAARPRMGDVFDKANPIADKTFSFDGAPIDASRRGLPWERREPHVLFDPAAFFEND